MIDRENVISNLEMNIRWISDHPAHQFPGWGNAVAAMTDALELLKEEESIVRCKDCKYANHETPFFDIWCDRISTGCYEDWFCADGERREAE